MIDLKAVNIYLASNSPRRKAIFDFLGLDYQTLSISTEEDSNKRDPLSYCLDICEEKLQSAKGKLVKEESLIIVADTIVCLGSEKFGKPKSRKDAFEMLKKLSGKTHKVITGVGYHFKGKNSFFWDETQVDFLNLTDNMINFFLDKDQFLDKAGSYGIQSEDCFFIGQIKGSLSNVIGFPLEKFSEEFSF